MVTMVNALRCRRTLSLSAFQIKSGRQAGGGCGAMQESSSSIYNTCYHCYLPDWNPLPTSKITSICLAKTSWARGLHKDCAKKYACISKTIKVPLSLQALDGTLYFMFNFNEETGFEDCLQLLTAVDSCCILLPSVSCCFVPLHSGQVEQETTLGDVVWISCAVSVSGMELWRTVNYIQYQSNPKQLCRLM